MTRIPASTWAEIRIAYASGIGLRELARNMNIPQGTVLARAKREGWMRPNLKNGKKAFLEGWLKKACSRLRPY